MSVIARFNTAYDQKEIVVDAKVTVSGGTGSNKGSYVDNDGKTVNGLPVGTVVTFNGTTITEVLNPNGAYDASEEATIVPITDAMYIIAQSDATMSNGHLPVETLSYKYIGKEDFVAEATVSKPVALFKITDPTDVVVGIR